MEKDKHLGLHIDSKLHAKLKYVAEYDGRSASGEVLYLLRRYIADFETQHGEIKCRVEDKKVES
ncbi:MAG: hypothetical protein PHI98_08560 [Eubacteriales bacterium]|nr:hypothetical protein [Eubacteriales bacterium]